MTETISDLSDGDTLQWNGETYTVEAVGPNVSGVDGRHAKLVRDDPVDDEYRMNVFPVHENLVNRWLVTDDRDFHVV